MIPVDWAQAVLERILEKSKFNVGIRRLMPLFNMLSSIAMFISVCHDFILRSLTSCRSKWTKAFKEHSQIAGGALDLVNGNFQATQPVCDLNLVPSVSHEDRLETRT